MLRGEKDFADVIRVKNLKIGKLSWILWVGPIESHEPLTAENFLQLGVER